MKLLIQFSMKNALVLFLIILLIISGGIYSLKEMNMEKYPKVNIPYLTVIIPYPGASPEQSMNDIGEKMEREFLNLEGAKNVYTDGVANAAYSTIEFDMSIDMELAEQTVRTSVAKMQLPDLAEEPQFEISSPDDNPVVFSLGIYNAGNFEGVQAFVKENIIPSIEGIEGVSEVEIGGTMERYVFVRLLPEQLVMRGLTIDDVRVAIKANNLSMPMGDILVSNEVLPVRVNKELKSIDDVKQIKIFTEVENWDNDKAIHKTITLGEIAEVTYESKNSNNITRINGEQGVSVGIITKSGANVVDIVDQVKEKIEKLEIPQDYEIEVLRDQSIEIKQSVYSMLREAILGSLMAVIVTLLFLKNIRSTFIAVISIPVSILASFLLMKAMDYTLNIMTLAGIAIAVGRVVDDSIVVIENVFRRVRSSKERNDHLILQATGEVASAITSSTITTVAVFLPLAFVPGIVGSFFKPLAWTIVISLLISLIVAVTIVPLLSRIFLLKITPNEHKENILQIWYRKILTRVLKHRFVTLFASILILVTSVALIVPKVGTTFLPQENVNNFDVEITMEKGTTPEETLKVTSKVEKILLEQKEINLVNTSIDGKSEKAEISFVVKDSVENIDDFVKGLRSQFTSIPEPEGITLSGVGGIIGGSESRYVLVVKGANSKDIEEASDQIIASLKRVEGIENIGSSLEGEEPEIIIDLDEDKLAEKGLMPAMVAQSLRTLISGDILTTMRVRDEINEINIGLKMDNVTSLEELGEQKINNIMGEPVALNEIGELKKVDNISAISHLNGHEYIMIYGTIVDEKIGNVIKKADETIDNLDLPNNVNYYKEGVSASMTDGFTELSIAIIVSIFLVYLVMVIAFREGKAPFVILFAIPFSIIGALIGLYIVNEPIGMPAMIGLLMLNGIVVTNAIVLVDKIKKNESSGMTKYEALIEAGVVRIRPILMTAIATIGALIPMAISNDTGMVSKSLSVVVLGGLSTSTFLTLFIVPVLYSIFTPKLENVTK